MNDGILTISPVGIVSLNKSTVCPSRIIIPPVIVGIKVKGIADNAFKDYMTIREISIPQGTLTIGKSAFEGCKNLKNITIPKSVFSIGENAFKNCLSIEEVKLPASLSALTDNLFNNCTKLKKVMVPYGITEISTTTFEKCKNLSIIYDGTQNEWQKIISKLAEMNYVQQNIKVGYAQEIEDALDSLKLYEKDMDKFKNQVEKMNEYTKEILKNKIENISSKTNDLDKKLMYASAIDYTESPLSANTYNRLRSEIDNVLDI